MYITVSRSQAYYVNSDTLLSYQNIVSIAAAVSLRSPHHHPKSFAAVTEINVFQGQSILVGLLPYLPIQWRQIKFPQIVSPLEKIS